MDVELRGKKISIGESLNEIPIDIRILFDDITPESLKYRVFNWKAKSLYSNTGLKINGMVFFVSLLFQKDRLKEIVLDVLMQQNDYRYMGIRDREILNRKWLENNYGKPDDILSGEYVYDFEDARIYTYKYNIYIVGK